MIARFRRLYGASPLHLLSLLGCFAVAAFVALQISRGPLPLRTAIWFVGAVVLHDLVLFPLYALCDRSVSELFRRGPRDDRITSSTINYVRVPTLLSGLLLLVFTPVIFRRGEGPYFRASGLDLSPFLGRWLAISGLLFLGSALIFALRTGISRASDKAA